MSTDIITNTRTKAYITVRKENPSDIVSETIHTYDGFSQNVEPNTFTHLATLTIAV